MIGQALIVVAGGGLALGTILAVVGQLARARLRRRFRPTGRLVDIGGYRLHLDERGDGPTVVLEGGTWVPGIAWRPIAERISSFAHVVTYDRAGLGWSDPSPRPRTADVMADELHELLARAGVPTPYILVGHSFGGTVVRLLASRHPDLVAGIVLLDGAHEDQFRRAPAELAAFTRTMNRRMAVMFAILRLFVRVGVVALRPSLVPPLGAFPSDVIEIVRAQVASDGKVVGAMRDEIAELEAGNDRVRALGIHSLDDIPVRVVSHGRAEGTPPELGSAVADAYERVWQELQLEQTALSTDGRRVVAEGVGHDIPAEAPDLVVETVRSLAARRSAAA